MGSIENALARFALILFCIALMVLGFGGAIYLIQHHPEYKGFVYTFIGIGVVGALGLPSFFDVVYPRAQKIFVLVFPNGFPFLNNRGGGSSANPPANPPGPPTPPMVP